MSIRCCAKSKTSGSPVIRHNSCYCNLLETTSELVIDESFSSPILPQ
jgi:hypothetical protein